MRYIHAVRRMGSTASAFTRRFYRTASFVSLLFLALAIALAIEGVSAQQFSPGGQGELSLQSLDPGPRGVSVGAGTPIAGLSSLQLSFFRNGLLQFQQQDGVPVTSPDNGGLGPAFNSDSCVSCHSQPAPGGSSPNVLAFPNIGPNPEVAAGKFLTTSNTIPPFITETGPVREVRFKSDGGVHDLFTINGRSDLPPGMTCPMTQPNFAAEFAAGNLSFRIPTPVFGGGLIENISEATLTANLSASSGNWLGIHGTLNRSGNDGSITRFGWKAQNKSLLMFAGEAYNVEMGVTNELFPNERGYPPNPIPTGCIINATPEDRTLYEGTTAVGAMSDIEAFAQFMRFLDQPTPACGGNTGVPCSKAIMNGGTLFTTIGCDKCHTPTLTTDPSSSEATVLSNVKANLFSDLALHHMGVRLADGITQGNAGPDQFRTAPLWGVGQRVFFLHDGRTSNLVDAILEHQSPGSEADRVIENFRRLSLTDKQNLILFLRSL